MVHIFIKTINAETMKNGLEPMTTDDVYRIFVEGIEETNETLEDYNNIVNLLTQKVKQWAEMDQNK